MENSQNQASVPAAQTAQLGQEANTQSIQINAQAVAGDPVSILKSYSWAAAPTKGQQDKGISQLVPEFNAMQQCGPMQGAYMMTKQKEKDGLIGKRSTISKPSHQLQVSLDNQELVHANGGLINGLTCNASGLMNQIRDPESIQGKSVKFQKLDSHQNHDDFEEANSANKLSDDCGQQEPAGAFKKTNFTRMQTAILKKWFIQHADYPYLKDDSRKELSQKTGLGPKQVSNWFTNVRKRIWQPIKKKNRNKDIKDLMLKVKLRLESDAGSSSSHAEGSLSGEEHPEQQPAVQETGQDQAQAVVVAQQEEGAGAADLVDRLRSQISALARLRQLAQQGRAQEGTSGQEQDLQQPPQLPLPPTDDAKALLQSLLAQGMLIGGNNEGLGTVAPKFQALPSRQLVSHKASDIEDCHNSHNELADSAKAELNAPIAQTPARCPEGLVLEKKDGARVPADLQGSPRKEERYQGVGAGPRSQLPNAMGPRQIHDASLTDEERILTRNLATLRRHPQAPIYANDDKVDGVREPAEGDQSAGRNSEHGQGRAVLSAAKDYTALKSSSKNLQVPGGGGFLSDATAGIQNQRTALRHFVKQSKVLRFRDKMHNVRNWCNNSIDFSLEHPELVENPSKDGEVDYQIEEVDLQQIERIEQEYGEQEQQMRGLAASKATQKEQEGKKQRAKQPKEGQISQLEAGAGAEIEFRRSNPQNHKMAVHEGSEGLQEGDGSNKDKEEYKETDEEAATSSLPRSKSLSNNRSRSSQQGALGNDCNGNLTNLPYQFVPIVLICCPSVVKGRQCNCGFNNYYPANDFYKSQIQKFMEHQTTIMGQNGANIDQSLNNSGGSGGSGGSGFADSRAGGPGRNGSGSNPSNRQSSGQSWQTSAGNPLNFLALLNSLNVGALPSNAPNIPSETAQNITGDQKTCCNPKLLDVNGKDQNALRLQDSQVDTQKSHIQKILVQLFTNQSNQQKQNQKEENGKVAAENKAESNAELENKIEDAGFQILDNTNGQKGQQSANEEMHLENGAQFQEHHHRNQQLPAATQAHAQFSSPSPLNQGQNLEVQANKETQELFNLAGHLDQANNAASQMHALSEISNSFSQLMKMNELKRLFLERAGPENAANGQRVPASNGEIPNQGAGMQLQNQAQPDCLRPPNCQDQEIDQQMKDEQFQVVDEQRLDEQEAARPGLKVQEIPNQADQNISKAKMRHENTHKESIHAGGALQNVMNSWNKNHVSQGGQAKHDHGLPNHVLRTSLDAVERSDGGVTEHPLSGLLNLLKVQAQNARPPSMGTVAGAGRQIHKAQSQNSVGLTKSLAPMQEGPQQDMKNNTAFNVNQPGFRDHVANQVQNQLQNLLNPCNQIHQMNIANRFIMQGQQFSQVLGAGISGSGGSGSGGSAAGAAASGQGHSSSNGVTCPSSNLAASGGGFQAFTAARAQPACDVSRTSQHSTLQKENIAQLLKSNGLLLQAQRDNNIPAEAVNHHYLQAAAGNLQEQSPIKKLAQLLQTQQQPNSNLRPPLSVHPLAQLQNSRVLQEQSQSNGDQQHHLRSMAALPVQPPLSTAPGHGLGMPSLVGPSSAKPMSAQLLQQQDFQAPIHSPAPQQNQQQALGNLVQVVLRQLQQRTNDPSPQDQVNNQAHSQMYNNEKTGGAE